MGRRGTTPGEVAITAREIQADDHWDGYKVDRVEACGSRVDVYVSGQKHKPLTLNCDDIVAVVRR